MLRAGFSYPLGQTQIVDVLRDVGAVADLYLSCPSRDVWNEQLTGPLLRAHWFAEANHDYAAGRTWLYLYAVPADLRVRARDILLAGPLHDACRWIKQARERPDSAWAGINRQWHAWLRDGTLILSET
jgi:hypothetical protein